MSENQDPRDALPEEAEGEIVDALPAVVESRAVVPLPRAAPLPVRQAARVAGVSFAAGAVASLVVSRRSSRWLQQRRRRARGPLGQITASRSFLVDIHLLRKD